MKSKSLEKHLLNKYNLDRIEDLNFEEIEELLLNKIDDNGNLLDYDFRDFEMFKNLKYVSLNNFIIKNYETNELSRCKNISAIQFSNCKFKSKSRLKGNIKIISFNNCKNFNIKYLSLLRNLEILKISNMKKVNLKGCNFFIKNVQKIYLENTKIINFKVFSKLKKLIFIQMFNCKYNKSAVRTISKNIDIYY